MCSKYFDFLTFRNCQNQILQARPQRKPIIGMGWKIGAFYSDKNTLYFLLFIPFLLIHQLQQQSFTKRPRKRDSTGKSFDLCSFCLDP